MKKNFKDLPEFDKMPERIFSKRHDESLPRILILGQPFVIDWLSRELRPIDGKGPPLPMSKMQLIGDEPWRF